MQYQCEWPLTPEPFSVWCTYAMPSVCDDRRVTVIVCDKIWIEKIIFPESLEERRVAMVSIPSCLYPIQWTFWKLPVFVAVLHGEWYECEWFCSLKFQLLYSRCDAFGQADEKSSLGFLMLFRWRSFFVLFSVGFSVFLYYRCNLVVFIFLCWDEGRCRPRLLSALSPSLFFIPFL